MTKSFAGKNTHDTEGKVKESEWTLSLLNKVSGGLRYIGLCGCAEGFNKHVLDAQRIGFAPKDQVFIERDWTTYQALEEHAKKVNFEGKIWEGDFLRSLEGYIKVGVKFGYCDFDGVDVYSEYVDNVIKICCLNEVANIHIVTSLRHPKLNKSFLSQLASSYKIEKKNRWQEMIVRTHLEKSYSSMYYIHYRSYRGRGHSPMASIVMIKKEQ